MKQLRLDNKSISYLVFFEQRINYGDYFKTHGLLQSANRLGYKTELISEDCKHPGDYYSLLCRMVKSDSKNVIIRNVSGWIMITFYPFFLAARLRGKRLIIDIPTPNQAGIGEIKRSNGSKIKKLRHIFYSYLRGPIPYWFFNTIIQYGNESSYFSFLNKKRTVLLGNGIDKDKISMRRNDYIKNYKLINIIGVANLAPYHGFDRMAKAVVQWNQNNTIKVRFYIVSGKSNKEELNKIHSIVSENQMEDYFVFCGLKTQDEIYDLYSKCDIAVGSLGLHRIGLAESSILKIREYCLVGIPFIIEGRDSDFPEEVPFRFQVSGDERLDDIINVFQEFPERRKHFTDVEIRDYALNYLTYDAKLIKLGL